MLKFGMSVLFVSVVEGGTGGGGGGAILLDAVVLVGVLDVVSAVDCDCSSGLLLVLLMLIVVLNSDSCLMLVSLLDYCC